MIQLAPTRLPKMGSGRVSLQRRKEYDSEMAFFRAWMQQTVQNLGFTPGEYRLAAYTRGFAITAARVGLSSTATEIRADFSAVC